MVEVKDLHLLVVEIPSIRNWTTLYCHVGRLNVGTAVLHWHSLSHMTNWLGDIMLVSVFLCVWNKYSFPWRLFNHCQLYDNMRGSFANRAPMQRFLATCRKCWSKLWLARSNWSWNIFTIFTSPLKVNLCSIGATEERTLYTNKETLISVISGGQIYPIYHFTRSVMWPHELKDIT